MKKNLIIYIITIAFSIFYILFFNHLFGSKLDILNNNSAIKAKVISIISEDVNEYKIGSTDEHEARTIYFRAKILSGKNKGKYAVAAQQIDDIYAGNQEKVSKNKKVLLNTKNGKKAVLHYKVIEEKDNLSLVDITLDSGYKGIESTINYLDDADYLLTEYVRSDYLIVLSILFIIFLLIFGRKKGINTIISLIFTCLAIFLVFIPAVLSGQNIYLWSIITCLFIIIMTLLLINNVSKKTFCAMIGCIFGVVITSILTVIMSKVMRLTGLIDDQSYYLQLMDNRQNFDLKAIIFAGIIIGAVGAIMDVAVELSSSLEEVYKKAKKTDKNVKSIWKSGITIGQDMIGTMSNTLVMAYIGNSLSTTILLLSYSGSLLELANREMIVVELLQIIVGSFGLLLTIPITSFICSVIYCKKNKKILID